MTTATDKNNQHPIAWVKPELDKSIFAVNQALESYGQDLGNIEPLLPSLEQLKLMRGTLHMLEFYGASLLLEDMDKTVRYLLAKLSDKPEDAYEALVQAGLSLSGYLEKLCKNPNDVPIILLPIINDLRAARKEPLLTESSLFLPNLSIVPKPPEVTEDEKEKNNALSESAKALRPYFQAALLTWYRNPKDMLSLQQLKLVIRNLESSSITPRSRQLWWIAGGLLEALTDKGIRSNVSIRLLIGQLDRYIKQLASNELENLEKNPPIELLKNLLFYVAHSSSDGERIKTLKNAYQLDKIILNEQDIQSLRNNIRSPKSETFKAIATELNKNLAEIKTVIDIFVRGRNHSTENLKIALRPLQHVADTLSLISLGKERIVLSKQLEQFNQSIDENKVSKDDLLSLASSILHIESVVNNIGNERRTATNPGKFQEKRRRKDFSDSEFGQNRKNTLDRLPETEYRILIQQAAEQAKDNILIAKNSILATLTDPLGTTGADQAPAALNEVYGCLTIINHIHAAELIKALMGYTKENLLDHSNLPSQESLDQFAEAMVGMEYYLEAVAEGRSELGSILAMVRDNLEKIGIVVAPPKPAEGRNIPTLESVVTHISEANKNTSFILRF